MIFIYLLICIIILSIFKELVYFIKPYRVVLISTQTKYITPILTQIINDFIKNTNNENFVEIGSGYSKVTRYMAKNYKWHKMIAIEINILLVYAMRILNIFKKLPIQYVQANIFKLQTARKCCNIRVYVSENNRRNL
jgi:tRNA G46 methylase TrmB